MTDVAHINRVRSIAETAAILDINVRTLRRIIARGEGPEVVQLSARRKGITDSARERWVASRIVVRAA
jgi:hypothetical protein